MEKYIVKIKYTLAGIFVLIATLYAFPVRSPYIIDMVLFINRPLIRLYNHFKPTVDRRILKEKLKEGLPTWAKDQIAEDLDRFREKGITQELLDKTISHPDAKKVRLVRFQIVKNKVYASECNKKDSAYRAIAFTLNEIAQMGLVKNVDFVVSLDDYVMLQSETPLPIFTNSRDNDNPLQRHNILMPDWLTVKHGGWRLLSQWIRAAKRLYPWNMKENKIFWRGNCNRKYRMRFVNIGKKHPNIVDARFTEGHDIVPPVLPEAHLQYKYQITFDGACCTWPGYLWRLYSGCVTLKHESPEQQWFYKGPQPYVHYIPVARQFNEVDIIKLHKWLIENDDKVHEISQNAADFVRNNLMREDMLQYFAELLNQYANLQKFNISKSTLSPA